MSACAFTEEDELSTAESDLVFNSRVMFQSRDQLRYVLESGVLDGLRRDRWIAAGLHSTGTGLVKATLYRPPTCSDFDEETETCGGEWSCSNPSLTIASIGSGVLSGDATVSTAQHVVYPGPVSTCGQNAISVSFDGEHNILPEVGQFVAYSRGTCTTDADCPQVTADPASDGWLKCHLGECVPQYVIEYDDHVLFQCFNNLAPADADWDAPLTRENPLLANRLFAMGLERLAGNGALMRGTRQSLRAWDFVPIALFGRISHTSDAIEGADFATLAACPKTYEDFSVEDFPQGPVPLGKPGIFFNQTRFSRAQDLLENDAIYEDQPETRYPGKPSPLWSLSAVQWPNEGGRYAVVVGNEGFHSGVTPRSVWEPRCVMNEANPPQLLPYTVSFDERLRTTLDSKEGVSGSAALMSTRLEREDGVFSRHLRAIGVVSAISSERAAREQWWMNGQPWIEPTPNGDPGYSEGYVAVPTDSYVLEEPSIGYTETVVYEEVPPLQPSDVYGAWARSTNVARVTSYTMMGSTRPELRRVPVVDPSWQDVPCALRSATGRCLRYGVPLDSDFTDEDLDTTQYLPASASNDNLDDLPESLEEMEENTAGSGRKLFDCSSMMDGGKPGIAIGVMGSALFLDQDREDNAVAGLHLVCAPFTNTVYTDNWQYIGHLGRKLIGETIITTLSPMRGALVQTLAHIAELRAEGDGTILRPLSMKLCPPNYYMSGIGVFDREPREALGEQISTSQEPIDDRVIAGVSYIQCEPFPDPLGRSHVAQAIGEGRAFSAAQFPAGHHAHLTTAGAGMDPVNTQFEWCENPFTLDQLIGVPDGRNAVGSVRELECDVDSTSGRRQLVGGFGFIDNPSGGLQGLTLTCLPRLPVD